MASFPCWKSGGSSRRATRLLEFYTPPFLVTDDQLDARRRLGISEADPDVARVPRGAGTISVVGLAGPHAMDVLYRSGPGRFGRFDAIVVDTPPVKKGGSLPGVLLLAPTDGDDASANLIRMLRATPTNTEIVLVRIDRVPKAEWAHDAAIIGDSPNRSERLAYLPDLLPRTAEVREALNRGQSVWTLPRRGRRSTSCAGSSRWRGWPGSAPARAPRCRRSRPPARLRRTSAGGTTMLDPARARAEADAAERRGAGTLWAHGPVAWETVSTGMVAQPEVVPAVEGGGAEVARPRPVALPRMQTRQRRDTEEVPTALLAAILARLEMVPPASGGVPTWLVEAIGNPLSYDAAAPHRKDVCARVDPALYRRLQAMKERLGLRTTAGAWEYVLRAGLAAAGRGQVR